jgi:hypothetical protein
MNCSLDRRAKEVRRCTELVAQLAAAHQEAADARAKVSVDAKALEQLCGDWSQLAVAMDELHGQLESAGQERNAVVHLSKLGAGGAGAGRSRESCK